MNSPIPINETGVKRYVWPGRYINVRHCEDCLWSFCNRKTPGNYL